MIALAFTFVVAAAAPAAGGVQLAPPGREDIAVPRDPRKEAELSAKRDQLIEEGKKLLPLLEGERKAELTFQLAELYWEKARLASLEEVQKHDEEVKAWLDRRDRDAKSAGPEPRVSTERSDGLRKQSLSLYSELLRDHPTYSRRDEVLFVKGYAEAEIGDGKSAVQTFRSLVRDYPESRFVPDAWIQLGERYFQANDLDHAKDAFTKARAFRLPKIYAFATYKLAWCDYNAGDYAAAIAKFQDVISYADTDGALARDRVQLRREALKDIVLSFARQGNVEEAREYLIAKGRTDGVDLVERLAATYFEDGKFEKSIEVYRALEAQAPSHPRAPSWQQRIVLAYDKLDHKENVLVEAKRLASEYAPASGWAKANAGEKSAVAQASELGESALRELVQDYHQEAVKTKSAATYRIARDMYRQYLDAYPQAESANRLRFYYAEILWSLEEWGAAAEQYGKVAEADPAGEFARKAAYDAILAVEKVDAQAKGKLASSKLADDAQVDERRAKGEAQVSAEKAASGAPEALTDVDRKLADACDRYVTVAKGAENEVAIRYKAAYLFYSHRQDDEALRRFKEIVGGWPQDPWARKAADLALDVLDRGEKWQELVRLADAFRGDGRLAPKGSELAQRLERVAEGGRFKHAMDLYEKKGDLSAAAREFDAFAAQHPRSSYAVAALNNAMVIAEKSDRLDAVEAAATRLLRDHPDADPQVLKAAALSLASATERTGRFADAAARYEEFAARWADDARAADRLSRAALWREALGDDGRAAKDWQSWLDEHADDRPAEAPKVAFALGSALERQKLWQKAAAFWGSFVRDYSKTAAPGQLLMARYKEALAFQQLRKKPEAEAAFADVVRRFPLLPPSQRLGPAVDAAAHARFVDTERDFAKFQSIKFDTTSQRALVSRLREKNAGLTKLLRSYAEVLKLGSPKWSAAALTRLGQAHQSFNRGLLDAPVPRGLNADEQDLYRQALATKAAPLEDKAVEAFRKAVETGERSGVYTEWAIAAQDALRDLQPDSYQEKRDLPYRRGDAVEVPEVAPGALEGPVATALEGAPALCLREPSEAVCRAALDAHPSDPRLEDALAEAQRAAGKLDAAEATVRKMFLRRPGDRGAAKEAARIAADRGRTRLAESLYARARTEDPRDPALPNELGILAARRGDSAAARALFLEATSIDPGFAPAWANLGALLLSYRNYAAAQDAFAKAVALDPARPELHLGYAWSFEGARKVALARAEFDEVLRLAPGEIDALYGRAAALRAEGQLEMALRAFREYVGKPNAPRIREAQGNISAIELRLKTAAAPKPEAAPAPATAPAEEKDPNVSG
ncbi:MAG: tetratricopeptide repeat protein [Myxococcales bacterium]